MPKFFFKPICKKTKPKKKKKEEIYIFWSQILDFYVLHILFFFFLMVRAMAPSDPFFGLSLIIIYKLFYFLSKSCENDSMPNPVKLRYNSLG